MTDTQQQRVYAWEHQWVEWNVATINLKQARELIYWACDLYNVEPPTVKTHRGKAMSYSDGLVIDFMLSHVNRAVALHEVAHHICNAIFSEGIQNHGPEWLAVYLWLLIQARIAPRTALCASAKAAGLKWLPLWEVSPKRLAKTYGGLTKKSLRAPVC